MEDVDLTLASGISAFEAKEFTAAMRLLSPLAEQGIAEAQYRMGMMYQNGLGLVKNSGNRERTCSPQIIAGMTAINIGRASNSVITNKGNNRFTPVRQPLPNEVEPMRSASSTMPINAPWANQPKMFEITHQTRLINIPTAI